MYLTQGLHRAVQQNPEGIATIFGDRARTFAEQVDRVARLAGALRDSVSSRETGWPTWD